MSERISRREFLFDKAPRFVAGWYLANLALDAFVKPKSVEALEMAVEGPFWPREATRRWYPMHKEIADRWAIEQMTNPNGALALYDLIVKEIGGESHALDAAKQWENIVKSMRYNPSDGYCSPAARGRLIMGEPSLEPVVFNGHIIDYPTKIALITAAATWAVPLDYTEDRNLIYQMVAKYKENGQPFVVNRPKPGQPGAWFVVLNGVSADLNWVKTDDFNLPPLEHPRDWIISAYHPLRMFPGDPIPAGREEEANYWWHQLASWRLPVDPHLIWQIVYNSPPAS